ncbi:hypothetical protein P7C73_g3909, partial [Tremellales sp. Uapishka_1]
MSVSKLLTSTPAPANEDTGILGIASNLLADVVEIFSPTENKQQEKPAAIATGQSSPQKPFIESSAGPEGQEHDIYVEGGSLSPNSEELDDGEEEDEEEEEEEEEEEDELPPTSQYISALDLAGFG